ncbi:ATP-dependent RNA helicase DRS1 [Triticum aestivum]|uniref:ATP-dependent RNA helicase DRS1 n=1 Tax=Triticum aestivum TaxID=4565 RepID=UPI000DF5411A|nr:ATP-dependent RNA helicase DRS1-like [Triticum aestivum]
MGPTQWWFQFGGDVPALQKCAMRICSQCVSSSGCERNWSAFALVHTKQRSRLLYDKVHKLVSVRYNLKIRAEEDQEKERDIDKEIDPSALLMDTTMFDETNPIMEWLNEDVEDPIVDGADAASAVFEQIRRLNSSRKASYVGSKGNNKKRKRNDDDENEFLETESEDDEEENEYVDNDIEDDDGVSEDDEDGEQDQLETQMQLEEETQVQVQKEAPTSTGHLETRSGRLIRKKTKNVNSLYS